MRIVKPTRKHFPAKSAALLAVALLAATAGCGPREQSGPSSAPAGENSGAAKKPVDAATAGTIKGVVKFDGTPPERKPIHMSAVPSCAMQHGTPPLTEEVVPGENGTLQNVVVYLQGDFSAYSFEKPAAPAQMDQKGCMYAPHVLAVMTGEPIEFLSSDATSHNLHAMPKINRGWNESQASNGPPIERSFAREEVAIFLKCNLHPWMRAYVAVQGNPYFQVTGKDGSFELKNVPPGSYTLTAWQETYGTKTQPITVGPQQEQSVTIRYKP